MDNMGAEKFERRQGLGGESDAAAIEMIEKMAHGEENSAQNSEVAEAEKEAFDEQLAQPFLPPEENLKVEEPRNVATLNFQEMNGKELAEYGEKLQKQYKDNPAAFLDAIEDMKEQR